MFYVWTAKVLDNLVIVQEQLSASVPPLHTCQGTLYCDPNAIFHITG
jgi:hypothetical protein